MKKKRRQKPSKKAQAAQAFKIPLAEWPSENESQELVALISDHSASIRKEAVNPVSEFPLEQVKAVVSIANNLWRARKRMVDTGTGEVREDMKRIYRDVEAIRRSLVGLGVLIGYHNDYDGIEGQPRVHVVIRDHTGDAYDEGQPMRVVASKPIVGLDKKRVSETLLPSIFCQDRLIQNGEIELAIPDKTTTPSEPQDPQL